MAARSRPVTTWMRSSTRAVCSFLSSQQTPRIDIDVDPHSLGRPGLQPRPLGPQEVDPGPDLLTAHDELEPPATHDLGQRGRSRPQHGQARPPRSGFAKVLGQIPDRSPDEPAIGPIDLDQAEPRERRVAQQSTVLQFDGVEALDVVEMLQDVVRRVAGLHEHATCHRPAARPTGDLDQQRGRPLSRAEIGHAQRLIRTDDHRGLHPGEVVALGDDLRTDEQLGLPFAKCAERMRW